MIIYTITLAVFWFMVGWLIREQYAKYKVTQFQKTSEVVDSLLKDIVMIDVSKKEGQLYSYNSESGEFLAQGKDATELSDNLIKRYPNKIFIAKSSVWDGVK